MNITFPANRRSIAENFCDRADGVFDVPFRLLLRFKSADRIERDAAKHRSRPGAKVFGGEIFARNLAQIIVHILRSEVAHFALLIDILEKILPGQVLQLQDGLRDALIGRLHVVHASALAAKTKTQFRAFHVNMSILHGR